jgi:hypothetical protein
MEESKVIDGQPASKMEQMEAAFVAIANQVHIIKSLIMQSPIDDSFKFRAEENLNLCMLWSKEGFHNLVTNNQSSH